ncbi:DNA damage-inducible protein DinB [Neptunitalea chrysea]|uniref:DNA damage-inducible protein DinB n=1 Tax=Neptunitalea chrysea TaxID=1647581 RepID=A0A9W6B631_9FLAO|nr:DinB family protein [Neptunitalea chrysea]GLB51987.1 DNA damage-inducible protein DinB [Neptunitalea chrysea]
MNTFNLLSVLNSNEFVEYQVVYLNLIKEEGIIKNLHDSLIKFNELIETIPSEKYLYSYADGKWTIQEVLQHIIDTERIFQYRGMSIARGEKVNLLGFDENNYVKNSYATNRNFDSLISEFWAVRKSSIELFQYLDNQVLNNLGTANNHSISTRAVGYFLTGHLLHHLEILKERYL